MRYRAMQRGIDRTALTQDLDHAADEEDQEYDVLGIGETVGDRHQELPRRKGDPVLDTYGLEGAGDDHLPVGIVGIRLPLEFSVRDDIRQDLREYDEREDQDE